jgi:cytochrome b pre-mRNA-processing protein 3
MMSIFRRLFGRQDDRAALVPLYRAIVGQARAPFWFREGGVADTLDGRFDMIAAVLSLALLRLESEGDEGRASAALLTEVFIDDMDGQLRQLGIGDVVVGKHIGKMMSAVGGRLSAYRAALGPGGDLEAALGRNLYRGAPPSPEAVASVADRLRRLHGEFAAASIEALLGGSLATA